MGKSEKSSLEGVDFGEFPQGVGVISKEKRSKKDPNGPVQGMVCTCMYYSTVQYLLHSSRHSTATRALLHSTLSASGIRSVTRNKYYILRAQRHWGWQPAAFVACCLSSASVIHLARLKIKASIFLIHEFFICFGPRENLFLQNITLEPQRRHAAASESSKGRSCRRTVSRLIF